MKRQITEEQADKLKRLYGTHEQVAEQLGITGRHWLRIRRGQHVTPTIVKLVTMMLEEKVISDDDFNLKQAEVIHA